MTIPLRTRHDAALLLGVLLNPRTCRVLSYLPARPGEHVSAEAVARQHGDAREAATVLARCVALGAVEHGPDGYALARDRLTAVAAQLTADSPLTAVAVGHPALAPFVRAGRLVGWPARPSVETELFTALAELFPPGQTLSEAEVTTLLGEVLDDPAAVRRGLVDRGLLSRAPGSDVYRVPALTSS